MHAEPSRMASPPVGGFFDLVGKSDRPPVRPRGPARGLSSLAAKRPSSRTAAAWARVPRATAPHARATLTADHAQAHLQGLVASRARGRAPEYPAQLMAAQLVDRPGPLVAQVD